MRIRWKSAVPAAGTIIGIVSDPQVLGLMPASWSHTIVAISAIGAILFPALFTNKPPTVDPNSQVQYVPSKKPGF